MRKSDYIRTRKLLKDPKNWNQGHYSVDKNGKKVLCTSDKAIRWCALTACNLFAKDTCRKELALAAKQMGFVSITKLNDNGTHEQLIKMFDLAIGLCDVKTVLKVGIKVSRWHSYTPVSEALAEIET